MTKEELDLLEKFIYMKIRQRDLLSLERVLKENSLDVFPFTEPELNDKKNEVDQHLEKLRNKLVN